MSSRRPLTPPCVRLSSENSGSQIGISCCAITCWMMRSVTVGISSFRIPPSGLGIFTRLTGDGIYFPFRIFSTSSLWFSFSHGSAASMVIPSTPGAPLFAFTLLYALFKLFLSRILPKMSGSALSLSFHIRLNERCALTYPLRSALPPGSGYSFQSIPYRPPWIPHVSFPPPICHIYCIQPYM